MRQARALMAAAALSFAVGACGSTDKAHIASTSDTATGVTATQASPVNSLADKSITAYGHEASVTDKQAITTLVKRYYAAGAAGDGATACSLIYSPLSESVAEDYGQAPGPAYLSGKTCAVVMSKLFRHTPGQPPSVFASTEVTGVRVEGRKGYALLRSQAIPDGDIPVERELGKWRVGAIIGGPLPGSQAPAAQNTTPEANTFSNYEEAGLPKVKDSKDGDDDPASNDDEAVVDYGEAASHADQEAIAILVRRYFAAASADDGRAICSLIYDVVVETIPETYEQSPGPKGRTCASVMAKVFASRHAQAVRDLSKLKVTRVRVEGSKSIAMVYLGKYPEPYLQMHRQGKEWKMQTQSALRLP